MSSAQAKKKDCPVQSIPDANIEAFFGRSTLTQFLRKESVLLFRLPCVCTNCNDLVTIVPQNV